MSNADYQKLQDDYYDLLRRHQETKQSLESQIESLKAENRRLEDECKGRGYCLIILAALLVFSVILRFFIR